MMILVPEDDRIQLIKSTNVTHLLELGGKEEENLLVELEVPNRYSSPLQFDKLSAVSPPRLRRSPLQAADSLLSKATLLSCLRIRRHDLLEFDTHVTRNEELRIQSKLSNTQLTIDINTTISSFSFWSLSSVNNRKVMAMSMEPFNRLVRLVARAFYDDITMKGENQPKNGRSDNRGMAVVVLDALTRRQWVREEDLAKSLKLHSKQLRRTLRFFEEEKLVTRDHRKETAKGAKIFSAAVAAATADGKKNPREGEEKVKLHTHSYCCLDYAQIYDVVRYRIHKMKKKLKDELDSRNTIQEYICPACKRRYSALDVLQLISPTGEHFVCERCNNELIAESDKLASQEMGDGDENARRRHREYLKEMLQKIEIQLKPLIQQINRVKDLPVPEFGSLQAWEARANAAGLLNGDPGGNDPNRANQGQGYGGTPMPYLGETKVEVALSGAEVKGEEDNGADIGSPMKQLPPWMIQEGMNLTEEQRRGRGEVKSDTKIVSSSTSTYDIDEKKPNDVKEEDKSIQDEYIKAYYAAMVKRQEELKMHQKTQNELLGGDVSNVQETHPGRQVGMKAKREDDDVEWQEAAIPAVANGAPKVNDLNITASESENEDDDGVDWEEG